MITSTINYSDLANHLKGEIHTGELMRRLYSTDASEYQEMPAAVAFPEAENDIPALIRFAHENGLSLIPRTAGTSLAGQVVGSGLVVDLSRMHSILKIEPDTRRVYVQPGVVRNELNQALSEHKMLFGPETSTANRAMIGGMVGNNSCGSNSVVYGSTREHLVSCRGFLSDGSQVVFKALTADEFLDKCSGNTLEANIYQTCRDLLGNEINRKTITERFPKASIPRRNTGYALDILMDAQVFDQTSDKPFNLCRLIAGSEGTLFLGVEFELDCNPLPPPHSALLCAHFESVLESLHAVSLALADNPAAVELIDRNILEATKRNREQLQNRFFVEGDPGAILVIDIRRETEAEVNQVLEQLISNLKLTKLGYAFPILRGTDQGKVWELRRAGQGLMSNIPGDEKPREVVEDTAVDVADLPAYIGEFDELMRNKHGIDCVYYAHAGSGELHTRPMFNLKTPDGLKKFRSVAEDIAALVRKYQGSLSGEHGDGRLRGEFIPLMVGEECYSLMRQIKQAFDPNNLFNPGKIIDSPPMDSQLRYGPDKPYPEYETIFDFSDTEGFLHAAEQCNGSGDCRKGQQAGGVMCPSYMATKNEKDTTRARANILRQTITEGPQNAREAFGNRDAKEVLDLCLSCKGCKSECPSNVDMAKLKAEFMQHYYDIHGAPRRAKMIAKYVSSQKFARLAPWAWNFLFGNNTIRQSINFLVGFHPDRTIPLLPKQTLKTWFKKHTPHPNAGKLGEVWLFNDEFTNYGDVSVGIKTVELLEQLGYQVDLAPIEESGRTWLSKGFVREAQHIINANTETLYGKVTKAKPMVGIEPSAILTMRDEAIDLARGELKMHAKKTAKHCWTFEEFITLEHDEGRINTEKFTDEERTVRLHGHCFQKALVGLKPSLSTLCLPTNYSVVLIPSGCCGMAGSFGYEHEHYKVSMQIGELALFPAVRAASENDLIAAAGTSCRHQIHDGVQRTALHPAEILHAALK
ncbi:FAD-binding and (Fe-S)-binding domain-containing protein [Cerasicoccus arenae]|uniref:Oxidoreductase n=1 Tax=Cerasicoccus arenae TaxID=424488 RepID=A0A8J3GD88_9BACT|nr:FAD-binding and (Fe-S)-binding domain-containing protein [Cerasicoccus arenae]MBK1859501.1 FAD-binding protein [Cerasicoccus arenae]GHB95009.1 oxidoreductase [Cerasicoccus arenae]